MKRGGPLKRKSKDSIAVLQRKLWELCKKIIRLRHGNRCYTCPRTDLQGSDWQTGHLWSKASLGAAMKYDLRILRPQCMTCNVWHGGEGARFYARMLSEVGPDEMKRLEHDRDESKYRPIKASDHYKFLITKYEIIFEEESQRSLSLQSKATKVPNL